jgi:small subunit ribosomal protein S13
MEENKEDKDFRHFVRIANTDLNGSKPIGSSLRQIKGVSFMFSNLICHLATIDRKKRTGDLNEGEIKRIEEIINDPLKFGAPVWMLNRRKDYETGKDKHLFVTDLMFTQDNDIKIMKKIKSYKGVRHILEQPVRGQKTKSNFRRNKGKVHLGVKKKAGAKTGRP